MRKANIYSDEWLDLLERVGKLEKRIEEVFHDCNEYLKNQSDARMELEERVKRLEKEAKL